MSILVSELILYNAANMPTDDTSLCGGAVSTLGRPVFTQFSVNAVVAVLSDGADTRTVTIVGRDTTGMQVTTVLTLNGTTEVVGAQIYERILSVTLSAASLTRTVTIRQGAGGSTMATIPIGETAVNALFINAASASSPQTRYMKTAWRNTNSSLTLTSGNVQLNADPSGKIAQGVATAIGETGTVSNRTVAPVGVTFVGVGTNQLIPTTGDLTSGSAIGVWWRQSLLANDAAQKNTFTAQITGNTT